MAKLRHKSIAVHILISPDMFKGSLSASQVCVALEKGIKKRRPKTVFTTLPLADGGEGTLEVIQQLHGGTWITADTFDPLMRPIQADYLWLADQKTAYIEMARASGLALLTIKERNPLKTSTFGTGVLITDALKRGAIQPLYKGNVKAGEHNLTAVFVGKGPDNRDYRRAVSYRFNKAEDAVLLELQVKDRSSDYQPEFIVQPWSND